MPTTGCPCIRTVERARSCPASGQVPSACAAALFLRQTLGFGGAQETVESSYGQMAGKRDISRLTVQVGRFAVHDVFDTNAYAMDARADFLNWSIRAAGAFDYPADKVGLTYGVVAELNQQHWALRVGYFLVGNEPNANQFDMNLFARGAYVTELETRYALFSRPGKLRVGIGPTPTSPAATARRSI